MKKIIPYIILLLLLSFNAQAYSLLMSNWVQDKELYLEAINDTPKEYLDSVDRIRIIVDYNKYNSTLMGYASYGNSMIRIWDGAVDDCESMMKRWMQGRRECVRHVWFHEVGHLYADDNNLNRGLNYEERESMASNISREIQEKINYTMILY